MKQFLRSLFLCALLLAGSATLASAQLSRLSLGPKAGVYVGNFTSLMLGVTGDFALTPEVSVEPAMEVIFLGSNETTTFVFETNGKYSFPIRGQTFSPFVMAGLGWWHEVNTFATTSETKDYLSVNIGGGLTFGIRSTVQPWGGLKLTFFPSGGSDVALQGGVRFAI